MNTDGVSDGRITQALIRGRSLRVRWSRDRIRSVLAFGFECDLAVLAGFS